MSEGIKTVIYSAVAVVVACVAFLTRPAGVEFTEETIERQVDKPLFPDFLDPKAAARLEIVQVKSDVGSVSKFEVARDKTTDLWTIPSHSGYPADAENQMRDVSLMFVDLRIRGIASTVADDHQMYGVVEPVEGSSGAAEGVGMLVKVENRDGESLANLIVGKSVKASTEERFVRKPGQDVVYVVAIDPAKLSTKFEDWIEKDLLKLNAWDIENVGLYDYSIVETNQPGVLGLDQRLQVDLKWDSAKSAWNLDKFLTYRGRETIPTEPAPDESLNSTKLNEFKTALDDLEIVDVLRKPKGMTADLRADQEFLNNAEAKNSLVEKGFFVVPTGPDSLEIKSANGEIHVAMKDGVKYVLRFGDTVPSATAGKVDRFLFVTAAFDESRFPVPEMPAGLSEPAAPPANANPAPANPAPANPAPANPANANPANANPANANPAPANPAPANPAPGEPGKAGDGQAAPKTEGDSENKQAGIGAGSSDGLCEQEATSASGAAEAPKAQDPPASAPAAPNAAAPVEPAAGQRAAPAQPAAGGPPANADETKAAERERLLKEYQRTLDERNEKVESGKQKVRELNGRFADWYYVISEDLYRKIHLGRGDIFERKPGTAEEGFGIDSFRQLEKQGLKKEPPKTDALP
ncbi:MAG: DUF4340 domain-containing protein [Planctomycetes bacterium]|nr:DUF4340 domain-containing protein [Planctomycetota bacterium]